MNDFNDNAYWISPLGSSVRIGNDSHRRWMMRRHGMTETMAEEDGWRRVVILGTELFSYGQCEPSPAQVRSINELTTRYNAVHRETTIAART